MKETSYQLGEYQIIETSDSGIWWKAHSGFGSTVSGRCFIEGKIVFLCPPAETEDSTFLKNEFLERLRRLPSWDKTKYYCTRFEMHPCSGAKAPKPKKPHPPIEAADFGPPVVTPSVSTPSESKGADRPRRIREPELDDFDLFMQSDTGGMSGIGGSLAGGFKSIAARIRKLKPGK